MSDASKLPVALDVREVAACFNVGVDHIYRLVRRGDLPHTRVGRALRFRLVDVEAYLEQHTSRNWKPNAQQER